MGSAGTTRGTKAPPWSPESAIAPPAQGAGVAHPDILGLPPKAPGVGLRAAAVAGAHLRIGEPIVEVQIDVLNLDKRLPRAHRLSMA
jgi:hypothetical protein